MLLSSRRARTLAFPFIVLLVFLSYYIIHNQYQIRNTLSYATRPLWDKSDGPTELIPHYYAEGLKIDENACKLHGWEARPDPGRVKLFDAVLFSTEVELLEIRMNELDAVVDRFFIVESNGTFTGMPKETTFAKNRARFAKFNDKIEYLFLPGFPLKKGQSPWDIEIGTRDAMSALLQDHVRALPTGSIPLVLMSDVDEIPSAHTLRLLKRCSFGSSIHLQLRNYLYSFEWYLGPSSWRASVHRWSSSTYYRHSKSGERILADAGWHCSYCFSTIEEYQVKMQGFSHADRIGNRPELLGKERIQEIICKGRDIFDMLPEAYNYADLLYQLNLEPSKDGVHLPLYLLENADKYRFLLPGGCIRES